VSSKMILYTVEIAIGFCRQTYPFFIQHSLFTVWKNTKSMVCGGDELTTDIYFLLDIAVHRATSSSCNLS
jgi:hypothetical protein